MITATAGPLVPEWVWQEAFPQADEDALGTLSEAWSSHANDLGETIAELTRAFDGMQSHTGPGADAATAKANTVKGWLQTIADGATELSGGTSAAALLVTHTKTAINVVLANLQSAVTGQLLQFAALPAVGKPAALLQIRQLHIAAQAQCLALHDALVDQLSQLTMAVDVQPKPAKALGGNARPGSDGGVGAASLFEDTGLTPTAGGAEQHATELVGADQHERATATNQGTAGVESMVDDPWGDASEQAFTDEERAQMQAEATEAITTGNTDGYDSESLTDAASTVTADEVDPSLITVHPPTVTDAASAGAGGAAGTPPAPGELTTEEILGGPGFDAPNAQPGGSTGPPPATTPAGVTDADVGTVRPSGSDSPVPTRPVEQQHGGPTSGAHRPGYTAPSGDAGSSAGGGSGGSSSPSQGGGSGQGGSAGHGGSSGQGGHGGGAPAPAPSAPTQHAGPQHLGPQHPGAQYPSQPHHGGSGDLGGSGGGSGSGSGGSGSGGSGSSGSGSGLHSWTPRDPSVPGTSSAGVSAPPASHQQPSAPVMGGAPMMGGAPAAPPPSAPMPAAGPNLTSAPMHVAGAPAAPMTGPIGGPAAPAAGGLGSQPVTGQPAPQSSSGQPGQPGQPGGTPVTPKPSTTQPPTTVGPVQVQSTNPGPAAGQPRPGEGNAPAHDPDAAVSGVGTFAVGAALLGSVWGDLRQPTPAGGWRTDRLIAWPTQFGPSDEPLAGLPAGMGVAYQRVLLPGEADALLTGHLTTVRGIVHPVDQVRHLTTPAQCFDALGLAFSVNEHGQPTAAFDRAADSIEVLRFNGVRDDDLVVPLDADVEPDPDQPIRSVVRDHSRPWTGTGSAPGATSTDPIDEFEVLGTSSVAVPHLSEIWRLTSTGEAQHLATWDARNAVWQGPAGGQPQATLAGRRVDNGQFAILRDGTSFQASTLTDEHSVLVAHGVQAPTDFVAGQDGSRRKVVPNDEIVGWLRVTTLGHWPAGSSTEVHVLRRAGDWALIDYAGADRAAAHEAGFVQIDQGQWVPRWVPWVELGAATDNVHDYAVTAPA